MPPCIWDGIPNHPSHQSGECSPQCASGRCPMQALAFPALAEAGAVSEDQGCLLSSPFKASPWSRLPLFLGSRHSKSSVPFSQAESSPAILLFYLWIFLLSCQSRLGSGISWVHYCLLPPLVKDIICHVEIWHGSVLHLLALGHPL